MKVVRLVWEFDCLYFAQYISIKPYDIDCKQTWCMKIYRMNKATWSNNLLLMIDNVHHMDYRSR